MASDLIELTAWEGVRSGATEGKVSPKPLIVQVKSMSGQQHGRAQERVARGMAGTHDRVIGRIAKAASSTGVMSRWLNRGNLGSMVRRGERNVA